MNYGFSVSHSMANETVLEVELPDHGPLRDLKVRIVRGDNQSHGGGGAAGPPGPGEAAPNAVVLKIRLRVPSLADATTDTSTLDVLATLRLVVADRETLSEAGLTGSGSEAGKGNKGLTRLRQFRCGTSERRSWRCSSWSRRRSMATPGGARRKR